MTTSDWKALGKKPMLPPDYIDPEITGDDRQMLKTFYVACRSEGGTADEIHLRGLRAVLARWGRPAPVPVPAATMRPMKFEDGRVGWYINHPDFYCDLEPDESGAWSVYLRERKTGKETLAAPQQGVPSKRIMKIAAETRKCVLSWDCNARLLGNVTAEEIADLCDAILGTH